jgi:hypothetical protein
MQGKIIVGKLLYKVFRYCLIGEAAVDRKTMSVSSYIDSRKTPT